MNDKADIEDGYIQIATDLAEALARADLSATQYQMCAWVIWHTYGNRQKEEGAWRAHKTTPYTIHGIAKDIGRDRVAVRRAGVGLIDSKVLLRTSEGEIGFNTRISEWPLCGQDFDLLEGGDKRPIGGDKRPPIDGTSVPLGGDKRPMSQGRTSHVPGTSVPPCSNAREAELSELSEGVLRVLHARVNKSVTATPPTGERENGETEPTLTAPQSGPPPRPKLDPNYYVRALAPRHEIDHGGLCRKGDFHPDTWDRRDGFDVKWAAEVDTPGTLPGGGPDTIYERGLLGHPRYHPSGHPDWRNASFDSRDTAEKSWRKNNDLAVMIAEKWALAPWYRTRDAELPAFLAGLKANKIAVAEREKREALERAEIEAEHPTKAVAAVAKSVKAGRVVISAAEAPDILDDPAPAPEPVAVQVSKPHASSGISRARAKAERQARGLLGDASD